MAATDSNGGPVTMRTLNDRLELVRQEQRTEHIKTRALVVILAVPSVAKAVPYVLGAQGWNVPTW